MKTTVLVMESKLKVIKTTCNELEQYSRLECLELKGIPLPQGTEEEDTNEIVIKVGELLDVEIDEDDISISHCLRTSARFKGKRALPAIIVKFVCRDIQESLYRARKKLKEFTTNEIGYSEDKKIYINESLTEINKMLYKNCLITKKELSYNYLWTTNGKTYMRKDRDSHVIHIKNVDDLTKLQCSQR